MSNNQTTWVVYEVDSQDQARVVTTYDNQDQAMTAADPLTQLVASVPAGADAQQSAQQHYDSL